MAQTNETLFTIRGRVREFRKGVNETQVDAWINDRVRQALDFRTYWSSMLVRGTLSIPAAYTTGTVSVATGSNLVTGVGTGWPVSDIFNGTIPLGIQELGYQDFSPNAMTGITQDSILYVDAGGTPEAVPVVQVVDSFSASGKFDHAHVTGCTATQSSLVNRQFRLSANSPIFTILAVISPTTLLLDQPWGAAPLSTQPYQIWKMYYTLVPNVQEEFYVLDQQQGLSLQLHTSPRAVNIWDPQRLDSGPPTNVVDGQPSANGIIQYEIWPSQLSAYQLQFGVYRYWPPLTNDTDRPPWFINPTIFYHGALADALRYKAGANDPYHNPRLADTYEERFMLGLQQASNADESKILRELSMNQRILYPGGATFDQSHDADMWAGDF